MTLAAAIATWRSGGVEIAVIIQAVYNVVTMMFWVILHADPAGGPLSRFDPSGDPVPTMPQGSRSGE